MAQPLGGASLAALRRMSQLSGPRSCALWRLFVSGKAPAMWCSHGSVVQQEASYTLLRAHAKGIHPQIMADPSFSQLKAGAEADVHSGIASFTSSDDKRSTRRCGLPQTSLALCCGTGKVGGGTPRAAQEQLVAPQSVVQPVRRRLQRQQALR